MKKISLLWIIPLLALAICGYAIYEFKQYKGEIIKIAFPTAEGLRIGKTEVRYNGIPIGRVINLDITEDLQQVIAIVELIEQAYPLAREGSKFWLVRPKVSLSDVRHLQTIVSGVYIAAVPPPGTTKSKAIGKKQNYFVATEEPDDVSEKEKASDLRIIVRTNESFSLKEGAGVFYKGVEVGFVKAIELDPHGSHVNAHLDIVEKYAHLVRTNSVFWNQNSFRLKWGWTGVKVQSKPLSSLVGGGVAFATPDTPGPRVRCGHKFRLAIDADDEWLDWAPKLY